MTISVDFLDKHLNPPALPNKLVCEKCGDVFDPNDLNDDYLCKECEKDNGEKNERI